MGSDDIITLDSSSHSEHEDEENGLHESNSVPREGECGTTTSLRGVSYGNNLDAFKDNDEIEEGEDVQDMDLESDSEQEQPISNESTKLVVETPKKVEKASDDVCTFTITDTTTNNLQMDNSPIAGVKRARMTYEDQQPCVRVVYNFLTRESKKKLMELMQEWSEWHAQSNSSSTVNTREALENGEETYFPALHVGSEKTASVSFWVDNQARNEDIKSIQLDFDSVPLYDRGYTLGSTSLGGSADSERIETLEASRCFNCGSYSHSLKECPKPRDNTTISNARKQHSSKRNSAPGSRVQVRYYQKTQGKFDDLKPGVLGPETRESLGIAEFDPPPWLHRMRELGYPPGYLDVVQDEDQPSGISIFADEETKLEYEDGEIPEKVDPVSPERKMTVEFPGINAPIPENADQRRWASPSTFRNRSHHRPTRILDTQRGLYSGRQRNDGPPGTEYGTPSGYRSSDHHRGHLHERHRDDAPPGTGYGPSSGSGNAVHSYSPVYGHYDHNNSPHAGRNPNFGRSLSDRGWQSSAGYDGIPPVHSPHSPYLYPSGSRQAPADPYHSPSASLDRWAHGGSPSTSTSDAPSQLQQERQEHHHRRHHHQGIHKWKDHLASKANQREKTGRLVLFVFIQMENLLDRIMLHL